MRLLILTLVLALLAACNAQTPPPNRQLPILDPAKGIVIGIARPPPTTARAIPPNRKMPATTKTGTVVGVRQNAQRDIKTLLALQSVIHTDTDASRTV